MSSASSAKPSDPAGDEPSPSQADFFGKLVGVRSSKHTYYREYRHTAESLDRSIKSLEPIAQALTTLTGGPHALVEAVLGAVLDILACDWALLAVDHPAFGAQRPYIRKASPGGVFATLATLPDSVASHDGGRAGEPLRARSERLLVADLTWRDNRIGCLAARLPTGSVPDETDAAILQTLAHQVIVAIQNAWLRSALAKAHEQQIIADERQRIARELHDTVAQHVLSIGMNVEWCRGQAERGDDVDLTQRLTSVKELARATIEHIRHSIFELSAVAEPMPGGLAAALERLTARQDGHGGPAMTLRVTGTPVPLPDSVERELYLIAREALFNVTIHAEATRAEVTLAFTAGRVRLSVTDDGVGDADALRRRLRGTHRRPQDGYHRGLANMRHRARELGSDLLISRPRGGGLRVGVSVRLEEEAP